MSRNLVGTLTDPNGTALAGWTMILTATVSQSPTLPSGARETITLDASGGYSVTLLDGAYNVVLVNPANGALTPLGAITVTAGADVDVLSLLGLTAALPTVVDAAIAASEAGQVRDGDAAGGVLSGTYPNPGFAADMATQAELDAEAELARNADNLTSGTVADARIAAAIARDSEVPTLAWASGPPSSAFASLPAASAAPQAVYQITDANDGYWRSDGTVWRPLNGKAVLANYNTPDLTVQSTTETILATLSFPGGLITSGMRLLMDLKYKTPGIGTGYRNVRSRIGAAGIGLGGSMAFAGTHNSSGAVLSSRTLSYLLVRSSTSVAHVASPYNQSGVFLNSVTNGYTPSIDFSADWEINIAGQSCNETAVNITAASWAAGVATFTATAHTLAVGDKTTVASVNPTGYNGVYVVTTVAGANTFTVALASDPGAYVSGGTSSRISNVALQSYILEVVG